MADLVASGYGPAIDVVKKYSLKAEIEQRLHDPADLMAQPPES